MQLIAVLGIGLSAAFNREAFTLATDALASIRLLLSTLFVTSTCVNDSTLADADTRLLVVQVPATLNGSPMLLEIVCVIALGVGGVLAMNRDLDTLRGFSTLRLIQLVQDTLEILVISLFVIAK